MLIHPFLINSRNMIARDVFSYTFATSASFVQDVTDADCMVGTTDMAAFAIVFSRPSNVDFFYIFF